MRMRHLLLAAASLVSAACSSGAPDEVTTGVAVFTQPAQPLTLPANPTYCLDPTVVLRHNGEDQRPFPTLSDSTYAPAAAAIRAGMEAAGYQEVPWPVSNDPQDCIAGVGLKLGVATATQDYYYSGGWCDPYYYWYGCYYPPVYAGSYSYGVGILGMVDLTAPQGPTQPFPSLWGAFIYGISTGATNPARLAGGIDRAFAQSPYLAVP